MEMRQLRYFAAVVEQGTVTGAARQLNMTQPPLTAQLHSLEEELGCRLFDHAGRRLQLTEAGRALYARARTILSLCDAAADEMHEYRAGTAGTLHLGVVSSVGSTLFAGWLARFAAGCPAVRYELYGANTYQLLEQLQLGQLDLAIVRTPFPTAGVEVLPLEQESMLAAGLPAFFAALPGEAAPLAALAPLPLIVYRRWEHILQSRFEAAGCVPHILCRNDDAQTTLALARRGLGVALLPASALPPDERGGLAVRRIADPALDTRIAAVCRSRRQLPQAARLFWAMLESGGQLQGKNAAAAPLEKRAK